MLGKRLINSNSAAGATCTTDTLQILGDTSCVAYYKMSDATDESGNFDGTPTDVNFNVAGKFGNAGSFNGTSSKINTGYIQTGQVYSTSFWAKNLSAGAAVLRDTPAAGGTNTFMDIATGANGQVVIGGNAALDPANTPSADWIHYVVVLDGTNATIFTNGSQTVTRTYTAKTGNNGTPVHIMSNGEYFAGFASGSIDNIRIFNKAITTEDVETLYNEVYCQPTIVPTDNFEAVTYTGNGGTKLITSLDFPPDLVWIKRRGTIYDHALFDSVRGVQKELKSNLTTAESTKTNALSSFDSNGWTMGSNGAVNDSDTYVAWNWKAGGADVLNEEGTIDSQVSANVDAGFSIVKQTSNNTNDTYGHGLDEAPEMIISKNMGVAGAWGVYHKDLGTGKWLYLNTTASVGTSSNVFPIVNDTVFSGGSGGWNNLTSNYINYCFHSVDGYSKIGSYTGTGGTGNSIVTGFRPAFVMIKGAVTPNATNWWMFDNKRNPTNPLGKGLISNLSAAEQAQGTYLDFNSNGFTWLSGSGEFNDSGNTFIFMAFAEEAFVPDNFFNDDSTVATYKLNGDAGDDSGNGYNGTPSNVTYAAGKFDDAAVFNGSSSKIVLPTSTFSPSTFTISAWCNVSSDTDENTILELVDNQTYPNHTTIVLSAGSTAYSSRFLIRNHTTNQYNYESSGTVTKNVWKHYAMTYDGSTVKSYIDGFLVNSGSLTLSNTVGTISSIQLGLSSGIRYLNGKIDQVRIFDRALDSGEVTQLYNE